MDLLETIKSAIARNKNIERKDGNVHISSHAFSGETLTCVKRFGVKDTKGIEKEKAYYSLDCLIFFWSYFSKNPKTDHASYSLQCADNNVDAVSFPQKDALLAYLNGKSSKCEYVDLTSSLRYAKPISNVAGMGGIPAEGESGSKSSADAVGFHSYKRLREVLGNEKVYETRAKIIAHNGRMKFTEAIGMIRRDEQKNSRQEESWSSRMNVSTMAINPEEGFLTQSADSTAVVGTSSMKPSSQREFIIVVPPSGGNNVITMYNAQEFIEHGKYIPSEEIRRKNPVKPQEIILNRDMFGQSIRFRFIDNPARLSESEWNRIVCVIAGSQTWQFRGWRISNPAMLFSKSRKLRENEPFLEDDDVLGIFMWFNEMPVPPIIKGWKVSEVCINRDVRNMDMVASVQFWDMVEKAIKTKRMDLLK